VKINPRVQKDALLLLGAAVAGPALVVAGWKYPGTPMSRGFLVLTGLGMSLFSYRYFSEDVRGYLVEGK
jgi:hypothetical protein